MSDGCRTRGYHQTRNAASESIIRHEYHESVRDSKIRIDSDTDASEKFRTRVYLSEFRFRHILDYTGDGSDAFRVYQ